MENKAKRPSWVSTVGIIGIIFSILGILGGTQDLFTPQMIEKQKEMFKSFDKTSYKIIKEEKGKKNKQNKNEEIVAPFSGMQSMFETPEWYNTWIVTLGICKIALNVAFLLISLSLLSLNQNSLKLIFLILGSNIIFRIIILIITLQQESAYFLQESIGSIFDTVINIVLLIVVLTGTKDVFKKSIEEV